MELVTVNSFTTEDLYKLTVKIQLNYTHRIHIKDSLSFTPSEIWETACYSGRAEFLECLGLITQAQALVFLIAQAPISEAYNHLEGLTNYCVDPERIMDYLGQRYRRAMNALWQSHNLPILSTEEALQLAVNAYNRLCVPS